MLIIFSLLIFRYINNEKIINIQSEELREIYKEFEKKRGYSPFLLEVQILF
jgi:uncharacterized protein YfkK (UPF0435 family)